jgi:hypothetical protein
MSTNKLSLGDWLFPSLFIVRAFCGVRALPAVTGTAPVPLTTII